jgi:transposase InsO family protein
VNLVDAKDTIERWRVDYNTIRPHSSLNGGDAGTVCQDHGGVALTRFSGRLP